MEINYRRLAKVIDVNGLYGYKEGDLKKFRNQLGTEPRTFDF